MAITAIEMALLDACGGNAAAVREDNWLDVLLLGDRHEVTSLVISTVLADRARAEAALGGEAVSVLAQLHAAAIIQQGLTIEELGSVSNSLAGIEILALKGPALAERCYPAGARLCRDIDIAVHPRDYERARDRIGSLGYRPVESYDEDMQRLTGRDMSFARTDERGTRWSIELHWMLAEAGSAHLNEDKVWQEAVHLEVAGLDIVSPNLEDTILLLAVNLRKHRFARLKIVCDLDRLVKRFGPNIDWDALHNKAHAAGVCILVRRALELSHELLGTDSTPLPVCTGVSKATQWLMRRLVTTDAVLADGRDRMPPDPAAGIFPFIAVDKLQTMVHLGLRRVTLSPELASYHAGQSGAYTTRRAYIADTLRRVALVGFVLTARLLVRTKAEEVLPTNDFSVITRERSTQLGLVSSSRH